MNKQKQLSRKLTKIGIMAAIVIAVFAGVFVGISMYADSVAAERKKYEDQFSQDRGLLSDLHSQMDKSGEAEKRYLAIQADRTNPDLAATIDGPGGLDDFLRNAKTRYHFDKLTIKPVKEVPSDKPELANFPYNISLRPHLVIQFQAVSDVHVFSFMDDLRRAAPGFIRIDKMELKRTSDITDSALSQMQGGASPILVTALIEFTWVRIVPKDAKNGAPGGPPGVPPGSSPIPGVP